MEITSKYKDNQNGNPIQSPLNSPSSHGSSTTTTTTTTTSNGLGPITRSDPNSPYPTTFVTADTSSFKQVVQMLTGSSEPVKNPKQPDPKIAPKKQGFKLYERRNSLKNMISPLTPNFAAANQHPSFSPRNININNNNYHNFINHINNNMPEILSPSLLDFPSLTLSPVTPLVEDPFNKSSPSINGGGGGSGGGSSSSEEDKAIAEKGFFLHPSPRDRDGNPQLLPLFPLSSPRVSDP